MHSNAKAYQPRSQKPMAKNNTYFQSTDHKTPHTNYRKNLMSSKKKTKWANRANFSPCRYEVDETRQIATKDSKNNLIVVKAILDSNFNRFRDSVIQENFNPKPEIHWK